MNNSVEDNVTYDRYEMPIAAGFIAAAYDRIEDDTVILVHTEVPFEYSGQGIGSRLADGVFDLIRQSGRKVVPKCTFMAKFSASHPEYRDMIAG
ncbi:GNAT family N-acetyltransferase [Phyllobacterium zundukense]|uniref:N-acetyltransferase n=1 Tax=Phyllobacterium zundukense TaxID=1867719 RepID=A0A2N9W0E8_9HYPH|nr:GNAT family N-acetyltransferase [Phyllobacterium zundukense]ATU90545.1 N-acetyltransferase [Phyllobacterium zundukense]PIO45216.1 N-acetyltransferase [Phyllobacterium zundukense]